MTSQKMPVIFFGRLEERKGLCTFVEAVQLLDPEIKSRVTILFLGKVVPLYSAELSHLNSQQYIERELGTHFSYEILSNLYSSQAIQYVQDLEYPVVCLTSPQENFPNSALEMGQLPVNLVVSDTGGFRETLQLVNRESGVYWFKPKDSHSLAQALSQALMNYFQTPPVCEQAALEQLNQRLLAQKLEYIQETFSQSSILEDSPSKITIALTHHNQGKYLIDCLSSIEAQTYNEVEVIVLDDASTDKYSQDMFEKAHTLFPNYQFIQLDSRLGLGAVFNHLIDLSTGDYFLLLDPNINLLPCALEKFAEAAGQSKATIVICPRKEIGAVDRIVNFSGETLPTILKSDIYGQACALFSVPFLKKFRPTESKDIHTPIWEIIAATVATGKKIIYYPYPLYEYRVTFENTIPKGDPLPREQYSLRNYLAQIPPSDWSPRQIYMLITAIQQLQSQRQYSQSEVEELRSQISNLQSQLQQARNEAEQAKTRTEAMETSKFWKLRAKWFRVKRTLGLPTDE
ncbi:MAG: glycosyltransferase [Snowella sp.]|nr:glycosyltransferase [Snowella sp.]